MSRGVFGNFEPWSFGGVRTPWFFSEFFFVRHTYRKKMLASVLRFAPRTTQALSTAQRAYCTDSGELRGSKTHQNLIDAFAGESMANRRYTYFAAQADVEGYADAALVFRSTGDGETGHAMGHLEFLEECGDPATDLEFGSTRENLKSAIAGETHEYTDMYPGMAKTAREEGFDDVAEWFETLAMAEKSHAGRFQKCLDSLDS